MKSEWITIKEAAGILNMSGGTVRSHVRSGHFEAVPCRQVPREERRDHAQRYVLREQIEMLAHEGFGSRLFDFDGKTPSYEDCIYLASFIDGEGCIIINRMLGRNGNATFSVGVSMTNTYKPVIVWAHETFGGSIQRQRHSSPWKDLWVCYQWCTTAYRTLQRVGPFLKVKHQQAQLAIEFYEHMVLFSETGRGQTLPPEIRAWREEQWQEMKRLNAGWSEPSD